MADTVRKFSRGELITAVVIALAAGFFAGTVVMELRQPASARMEAGAGPAAPAAEQVSPDVQAHITQLEVALATKPDDQAGWVELGNLYFDTHQAQKSIAAYKKALALGAATPDVLTDMGAMQREAGQPQEALKSFEAALKINPRHEHALYNKGVVLLHDVQDRAGAAEAWGKLIEINPNAKTPDGRLLSGIVAGLKKP